MASERQWDAVATITVNGKVAGPYLLGKPGHVTIGRSERAGLQSPSSRVAVPRELARLRCTQKGWMLQNEGGTVGSEPRPVRIIGPDILSLDGAVFAPHAFVLMSKGTWKLRWDVGVVVTVVLEPAGVRTDLVGEAVDEPRRFGGMGTIREEPVELTELQRRNMTALFAYLIRGEPEPKDPYAEAARLLGGDAVKRSQNRNLMKSQFRSIQKRLNRKRPLLDSLSSLEEVGNYLVYLSQTLGHDDLEY